MKQTSLLSVTGLRQRLLRLGWRGWLLAALVGGSVLFNLGLVSLPHPLLATVAAMVSLFLLPGWLLIELVYSRSALSWSEKIPLAFGLGLGLLSLPTVLLLAWQAALAGLGWASSLINLGLAGLAWRNRSEPPLPGKGPARPLNSLLLAAVFITGISAILLYLLTASTWSFGDNWTYLSFIRHYLDRSLTPPPDPISGTVNITGRTVFNNWWVLQALLSQVASVEPVAAYVFYLPPLFMAISLLAFYSLAKRLLSGRNAALLAVLVQLLYCFSSLGSHDWIGRGFFDRILEDKFLIWLILLPVVTVLMFHYLETGHKSQLLTLALGVGAVTLAHPLGLIQVGLSWGAFGLVYLVFNRRRSAWVRLVFIFLPVLLFLTIPLLQRSIQSTQITAFTYARGSGLQFGLSQTRLWTFSVVKNLYMAHPQLVAHPLTLLAIGLTPLLILYLPHSAAAQYLFGNMAGILVLLYNPFTAPLLGHLITPWMLWRITWLLPVALTLGFFGDRLVRWLQQRLPSSIGGLVPVLLVLSVALPLLPYLKESTALLRQRRHRTMHQAEWEMLTYLGDHLPPNSTIMANLDMSTYIPAFTSSARVLSFRWQGPPETMVALNHFYRSRLVSQATLNILAAHSIEYVIIERQHLLAFQMDQLPTLYKREHQNGVYNLYRVRSGPAPHPVINGNTHWLVGRWVEAEAAYKAALATDSAPGLAYTGLGQTYQSQNRPDEALAAYQKALEVEAAYLPARLALARLLAESGQVDAAIHQLEPTRPGENRALFEALGDLYLAWAEPEQAFAAYQQAVDRPPGSPAYYLALAELVRLKGLPYQAAVTYRQALALNPPAATAANAYAGLGLLHQQQGLEEEAGAAYQQAINLAPDNSFYHTLLADMYLKWGQENQALELYWRASRRNPNAAWPHLELGKLYLNEAR